MVAVVSEPRPRNESGPDMVQLVRRGDKLYVRAAPRTIEKPSTAQIKTRIKFGELARETRGIRDPMERARHIAEGMRGLLSRITAPEPLPAWALRLIEQGYDEDLVREAARAWRPR